LPSYAFEEAKWGGGSLGSSGGIVTWSFALTSYAGQPFDFEGTMTDDFRLLVRKAFDRWESVADIDFVEAADSPQSDIRVGFDSIDGPSNTLAEAHYRYYRPKAGEEFGSLSQAYIRFDNAEGWGFQGPDLVSGSGAGFYPVALHEIGHTIGLAHVTGEGVLMNPRLTFGIKDLMPGDMAGAAALYGQRPGQDLSNSSSLTGVIDVFRFYETRSGTHLYTSSAAERDAISSTLPNYKFEGVGFQAVPEQPGADAVYRFFKPETGTHFFTPSVVERDSVIQNLPSYRYEGVGFYASDQAGAGLTEVYRFFKPEAGTHFYTSSVEEKNSVQATLPNYQFEGVSFYVPNTSAYSLFG
jgi:hypothetical protein